MHLNSKLLFAHHAKPYFQDGQHILEIGPLGFPTHYSQIINNTNIAWHTLELADKSALKPTNNPLHIVTQHEYHYPVKTNRFDIVLSGQVMEHVKDIWQWMDELYRITQPGGHLIIICPVSWDYHEAPVDCWRIYPDGMETLLKKVGFEPVLCQFESLEKKQLPSYAQTYPGNSMMNMQGKIHSMFRWLLHGHRIPMLRALLRPISVAYDTICIAQKPL